MSEYIVTVPKTFNFAFCRQEGLAGYTYFDTFTFDQGCIMKKIEKIQETDEMIVSCPHTQGNSGTEGNSGNCQSGNCHSGERWMRKPSVHGGK